MIKLKTSIAGLALVAAFATSAMAVPVSSPFTGIIDTFETSGPTLVQNAIGWSSLTAQTGAGILGGSREMAVAKVTGPTGKGVAFDVSGGALNYSSDVGVSGTGYVRWDGEGDGLAGFGLNSNWSEATQLHITSPFSDGNFTYEITLWTDATHYSTVGGTAASVCAPDQGTCVFAPDYTFTFDMTLFNAVGFTGLSKYIVTPVTSAWCGGNGCVDILLVNAVTATIDPSGTRTSLDMSINDARTVPEPGSLALLGIGMLGAGVVSRRKLVK